MRLITRPRKPQPARIPTVDHARVVKVSCVHGQMCDFKLNATLDDGSVHFIRTWEYQELADKLHPLRPF